MQTIQTPTTAQRGQGEQARARAIVRFNSVMFHSLAAASLLEAAAPAQAERMNAVLAAQPEARLWLEQVWTAQRAELGRRLREYVAATWPEFDWNAAEADFQKSSRARAASAPRQAGAAQEALAACIAAAQSAVFYRGLARAADEPSLRGLASEGASAHRAFFDYFRGVFERCKRRERVGFAAQWRALPAACRSAREVHVRAAFEALPHNWNGARTVPELAYGEFVERLVQIVRRHAGLGHLEQFLFRPWLKLERAAPAPVSSMPALSARHAPLALQAA